MKKALKFIWSLLKSNLLLKIMALLFAVVLWSYVLAETDPMREKVLNEVPVNRQYVDQLEAKGYAISESLSEQIKTVTVRVDVKQSYVNQLSKSSVSMKVDLSAISGEGDWELDIIPSSNNANCSVLEVIPNKITVHVDKYVTREIPVSIVTAGTVADGYHAGDPIAQMDTVTISGARVDVEKAHRAVCEIDLTGLTFWNRKSLDLTILDSENNVVDATNFIKNLPSVIVDMDILPKKTVPVNVADAIMGQEGLAAGYEITDIKCDPAAVDIVGEAGALADITAVDLVPYSVSNASGDIVVPLDFVLPEGVTVLDAEKAQVTVTIREKTSTEEFTGVDIDVRNLSRNLSAALAQAKVDVTVFAGVSKVSKLHASDVVPYINLNGYGVGTYTLDILFELPEGFAAENFSADIATVTVTITRG